MVINKNETFRRKRRPLWYGMLCLVLITAAAATVGLIPMQSNDISSAEGVGSYTLSGGGHYDESYADFKNLIAEINKSVDTDFTITVYADDIITPGLALNRSNTVTLTSSYGNTFTLTVKEENGRHFSVYSGATLTLENIILDGNEAAGGIMVSNGTLIMNDGAVIQNCKADDGGGVRVGYDGTFIMKSGEISGNTATNNGGGVYNNRDVIFTMEGGEISGNTATNDGGGVYNDRGCVFTMEGGEISGNTADLGGGVYNDRGCVFTMEGGEISGNTATNNGGGVYNDWNVIYTMNGGEISGNTADLGGGVFNGEIFTMNGGEISGNEANTHGGGVFNDDIFTMEGGVISDNTATFGDGSGVYNYGEFTMEGGVINGNTATFGEGGGVYNAYEFTMEGGVINGNTATVGKGGGVYNIYKFVLKGGEISDNTATFGEGGGVFNGLDGIFTMNGGDISGNTAKYGDGGGVYNCYLFILDGGEIGDNTATYGNGSGVYNDLDGIFTMNGGDISGNTATHGYGGGVYNDGLFIMGGGKIDDNTATHGDGGGVYNEGEFTMKGGEISGNTTQRGGGVYNEGEFTMEGGVISKNNASYYGGGVINFGGELTMEEGSEISGNTAEYGGGVYNAFRMFAMSGGVISNNTATLGGGVYISSNSLGVIKDGKISGNTATGTDPQKGSGGGIFTEDYKKLTVMGGVIFSGNTAPSLRVNDIWFDFRDDYRDHIGDVKLDKMFDVIKKEQAPAYNNFDINHPGDSFVVPINIISNDNGTVDMGYNNEKLLHADGYLYVPLTCDKITISVTPNEGYEFEKMIINESLIIDENPFSLDVNKDMTVSIEFFLVTAQPEQPELPEQPEQKDYFMTATADEGSMISPNGTVTVPYGENKTFLFSAKPGYQIKAVLVNGVEISSAELASGAYTFSNVMSNHTISVVSEVEAGSGGNLGGDGSDGTGSGPDVSGSDNLYVIGIICAMLAVIAGAIVFVWRRGHFRSDNE